MLHARGQIERHRGRVGVAGPQRCLNRRSCSTREFKRFQSFRGRRILSSLFINNCKHATVGIELSIASGRTDRRFVEARLDHDNGERARRSRLIWRVADRLHLLDIGDGIRQVAIDLAEVFFLTPRQHLFAAATWPFSLL